LSKKSSKFRQKFFHKIHQKLVKKFVKKICQKIIRQKNSKICQKLHHRYTYLKEAQESTGKTISPLLRKKGKNKDKQTLLGS
jgi:hypothetical protein